MGLLKVSDAIIRIEPSQCKKGARLLVIRGSRQRNNSWTDAQRMAMLDSILTSFQCTVYIIQDPPGSKKCDEVFDGAHKLETAIDFIQNKFPVKKVKSRELVWDQSPLSSMNGKYYKDLTEDQQLIFDNYEFILNIIPPEIAEDPDRLTSLWIRLNNSGNRVNEYESYIQIYRTFYEFLRSKAPAWFETIIYPHKESTRGEMETELMRMLSLSESSYPSNFVSQDDIYKKWRKEVFGETSKVDSVFAAKKADLEKRLKHLNFVYKALEKNNLFDSTTNKIVRRMVIGRIAFWCDTPAKFTHCSEPIIEYASLMLKKTTDEHMKYLGCQQPNVKLQRRLLDMIDRDIKDIVTQNDDPRFFTPAQRAKKLDEQGGKCTWCNEAIVFGQKSVGHHKRAYADGGSTTYDNLDVLHDDCHMDLHKNSVKRQRIMSV
jgi:hypothetical protein